MKSQIQKNNNNNKKKTKHKRKTTKKKKRKKEKKKTCGITNTNIFPIKKLLMRGQKLFWAKLWGGCSKLED